MADHCEGCSGENCEGCANAAQQMEEEMKKVREQADMIKNVIVVMSGKGGVGKSTVAVNLAVSLSLAGKDVGILDVDVHGPSVPKLLKIQDADIKSDGEKIIPAEVGNLKVMSVGLVTADRDEAIIWRGPLKYNIIKQFIGDVRWGNLDYLIIDCPPGTGDEVLSVIQLLGNVRGALVVTTHQDIATYDVRKSVSF
ncbi:MAG: P-loop NTPase, partial [Abditibacteriota bacterium]|nr:P-loop NTPase [Abditibacteriota bacterium]